MTEEIINADGTRNWEANILLDNIKRLEQENNSLEAELQNITVQSNNEITALKQENKELKEMLSKEPKAMEAFQISYSGLKRDNETLWGMVKDYKTALEEIKALCNKGAGVYTNAKVVGLINEVLNEQDN